MANVAPTTPQPNPGLGSCLGKGCVILVVFVLLLAIAVVIGTYFGLRHTKPRQLPTVETSQGEQQSVLQRWDEFQSFVQHREAPVLGSTGTPEPVTPAETSSATPAPANPTIEFTANDINQLISANKKARGKAFVSIAGGVGHVAVSIPLDKVGFPGRYLNGDFEVRSSPDGDPARVQVTTSSLSGVPVPDRALNALLGLGTLRGYLDTYVSHYSTEYQIAKLRIVGDRVVLEANRGD
jgi:hypothetical protein